MKIGMFSNQIKHMLGVHFTIMYIFIAATIYPQTPIDLERDILVYIQPTALDFPANKRESVSLNQIRIHSDALLQAFNRFNIDKLAKAFPDFDEADSVRISENGICDCS